MEKRTKAEIAVYNENQQLTNKFNPEPLTGTKLAMYKALCKTLGVVTPASKLCGVSRFAHYDWLKNDPNYKHWIEQLPDMQLDFGESALHKLVSEGNQPATTFLLKAKGGHRGWVDRQEVRQLGFQEIKITMDEPKEVIDIHVEQESIEHQDPTDDQAKPVLEEAEG